MFNIFKKKDAPATAVETPAATPPASATWRERLFGGLARTRAQLGGRMKALFSRGKVDDELLEELEELLLTSDVGIEATRFLLDNLKTRAKKDKLDSAEAIQSALAAALTELLSPLEQALDVS